MDRWIGNTAVVTGASSGIGAATCVALADAGIRVVGLARRAERIHALNSKVRGTGTIISRKCDVSNSSEVSDTFKWIEDTVGAVHIMINNAGVNRCGSITDANNDMLSEEAILSMLDINLKGTILGSRHAAHSMKSHGINGHIININSIAGHYIPLYEKFNVYPCTKHAVTAFTASLLNELATHKCKIKVTSLSPGLVITELEGLTDLKGDFPALEPEDIADAVLYVLSTPPHVNIDELTITSVTERRA
ncbi:unnamed protein product [Arctia plantaginis]|uniref:Farnesol dehydrogenase n=1 Tax=Arctia plantaginis TaxID=874455 RepID=A0A8S1AFR9_ARCPL|nr:unnamed protein product [Arctia plantaginis]